MGGIPYKNDPQHGEGGKKNIQEEIRENFLHNELSNLLKS
jgi:hypothetical protein